MHCPFGVKVRTSDDGLKLVIKAVVGEHNHSVKTKMPVFPDKDHGKASVLKSANVNNKSVAAEKCISKEPTEEFPNNGFPCLHKPGEFLTLHQLFEILSSTDKPLSCIPSGEKSNVYFVVQVPEAEKTKVYLQNPFSDDCGYWDYSMSPISSSSVILDTERVPRVVYLEGDEYSYEKCSNGLVHLIPLSPQPGKGTVMELVRHNTILNGCDNYRRRITCVVSGQFHNRAVVEYCGCQPLATIVHKSGRKKRRRNTYTNPQKIANDTSQSNAVDNQESQENKLFRKFRYARLEEGLIQNQMIEEAATIEIQELLEMLNKHISVQEVNHLKNKAPCVILYTDEQIDDMKRNIKCGRIIGVDRTYAFGDCLLTFTAYKNHRVLHKDSNEHPLFPGPAYLHWDEDFMTYHYFFAHLQTLLADTLCDFDIKLGSNLNVNLIKAIKNCFPTSVQMLCSEQLKKNLTVLLNEEDQYKRIRSALVDMVFGGEGLITSPDKTYFKSKVTSVLLYCHEFPILKEHLDALTPLLLTYVCEPDQKGYCRKLWTNGCASADSFLKLSLDKRQKRFPVLVNEICHIMTSQMLDLREALCGGVSHAVVPAFLKRVDNNDWIKKNEAEKVIFFKEYLKNELQ